LLLLLLGLLLLPDHKALDPALDLNGDEAKTSRCLSRAFDLHPRLSPSYASMQIKSPTQASVQAPLRRHCDQKPKPLEKKQGQSLASPHKDQKQSAEAYCVENSVYEYITK